MKTTLTNIKNTMIVAKKTQNIEHFSCSIRNKDRDISIVCTYSPFKDKKQDIYPYWEIEMKEEEYQRKVVLGGDDIHEVRDIFNGFCAQGKESYLETFAI